MSDPPRLADREATTPPRDQLEEQLPHFAHERRRRISARTLQCTIADDGVGFDIGPGSVRSDEGGLGLIGIGDRHGELA